jgi:hypothetical protein
MKRSSWVNYAAWGLAAVVSILAVLVWGQNFAWQFSVLTPYLMFPVLGLLAFSLMWTHYVAGALRRLAKVEKATIQSYLDITGYAVLALIVFHPSLLIWQLWRDGRGLPPESYVHYVGPSLKIAVLLGTASLMVFLAYELRHWFRDRKWWPWVVRAGDVAMLAIFYHGLRLGTQIQTGWFHWVWWFYGLTLVGALAFNYYVDSQKEA